MTTAIYPGSFDPITNGHLDVLERASKLFEKVIIAVVINRSKKPFLSTETKVALIQESISHLNNVEVDSFAGLTVEYAKAKNANMLIRGLRAVSDFEYEMQMAQINHNLSPELDTIILITKVENNFVSSSIVKEISLSGGDISQFVPEAVNKHFKNLQTQES